MSYGFDPADDPFWHDLCEFEDQLAQEDAELERQDRFREGVFSGVLPGVEPPLYLDSVKPSKASKAERTA